MALTKIVEFKGVQVPGAYIKIAMSHIHKVAGQFSQILEVEMSAGQGLEVLERKEITMPLELNEINPIHQGYSYLKTLSQYTDAVDC